MSHIILKADFEDVKRLFADEFFEGDGGGILLFETDGYVLPVVVARCAEGVILRVENGDGHLDQDLVQLAIASVARRIRKGLSAGIVRSTLSKRVLRVHGLFDSR